MSALYKKLYYRLFNRVQDAMTYINNEMILKEIFDWDHTRELLLMLQAAMEEAEDTYANSDDEEED